MTKRELDNEARLSSFRGLLLSNEPDEILQSIVRECAESAGAPIALVSLVMGSTQFFRAQHGLPPNLEVAQATSRCDSFCQFVVQNDAPLEVEDAELRSDLPQRLVQEFSVRAYLGVPLRVGGEVLGSLCILDGAPRTFSETDREGLQSRASAVVKRLLELRDAEIQDATAEPLNMASELAVIDRALFELGPIFRVAESVVAKNLSPEEAIQALGVLSELGLLLPDLQTRVRRLRIAAESEAEK